MHIEALNSMLATLNVDPTSIAGEDKQVGIGARNCVNDCTELIELYTLISLIRNPNIRNPKEEALRNGLLGVVRQIRSVETVDEAFLEFLKQADGLVGASPSFPEDATAGEAPKPRKRQARASGGHGLPPKRQRSAKPVVGNPAR